MKTQSKKKHLIVAGIAALLMASSLGLNINTIGVFLQPMASSLNVSMGAMSTHSMLISIGLACGAFIVPPALNYFNIRWLVLVSALGLAATTVGMSFSTQVWMFNVLGFIRGVAASLSAIVPLQLLINNWFIAKHGLATSFVFSFSGVAGALFSPILASIVENQGWRMALVIKAGILVNYGYSHLKNQDRKTNNPYTYYLGKYFGKFMQWYTPFFALFRNIKTITLFRVVMEMVMVGNGF